MRPDIGSGDLGDEHGPVVGGGEAGGEFLEGLEDLLDQALGVEVAVLQDLVEPAGPNMLPVGVGASVMPSV